MNVSGRLRSLGRLYRIPGDSLAQRRVVLALHLAGGVFEGLGADMVLPVLEYTRLEGGIGPIEDRSAY